VAFVLPYSSKLPPIVDAADLIVFQIIDKTIRNSKFRCLSEATSYYNNIFTFTLFIPEGRTGVAWEHSSKIMLFLPLSENKVSLTSLLDFLFESTLRLSFPSLFGSSFNGWQQIRDTKGGGGGVLVLACNARLTFLDSNTTINGNFYRLHKSRP
jgi:hypothetical protein